MDCLVANVLLVPYALVQLQQVLCEVSHIWNCDLSKIVADSFFFHKKFLEDISPCGATDTDVLDFW